MTVQSGKKLGCEIAKRNRQIGVCDRLHHQIQATDQESSVVTEGAAREYIPTAGARKHGAEFGDGESAAEGIQPSDEPDGKDECWAAQLGCNQTGRPQDAGSDDAADDDRN